MLCRTLSAGTNRSFMCIVGWGINSEHHKAAKERIPSTPYFFQALYKPACTHIRALLRMRVRGHSCTQPIRVGFDLSSIQPTGGFPSMEFSGRPEKHEGSLQ